MPKKTKRVADMRNPREFREDSSVEAPRELFKYRTVNEYTLSLVTSGAAYFSSPGELNDPFDAQFIDRDLREELGRFGHHRVQLGTDQAILGVAAIRVFEREQRAGVLRTRIFCVSEVVDSVLMWSHYADSHRGICVVLEAEEQAGFWWLGLERQSVNLSHYTTIRGRADGGIDNLGAVPALPTVVQLPVHQVQYREFAPGLFLFDAAPDGTPRCVTFEFIKHRDWSYERERRVVVGETLLKENPVHLAPGVVTGVVFGMRTSKADVVRVIEATNRPPRGRPLAYSRMIACAGGVEIRRQPISDIDDFIRTVE